MVVPLCEGGISTVIHIRQVPGNPCGGCDVDKRPNSELSGIVVIESTQQQSVSKFIQLPCSSSKSMVNAEPAADLALMMVRVT